MADLADVIRVGQALDSCARQSFAKAPNDVAKQGVLDGAAHVGALAGQAMDGRGIGIPAEMAIEAANSSATRRGFEQVAECVGTKLSQQGDTVGSGATALARIAYQDAWFALRRQGVGQ